MVKKYILLSLLILVCISLGFILGRYSVKHSPIDILGTEFRSKEVNVFTNPLIDCEQFSPQLIPELGEIEEQIESFVEKSIVDGNADLISVYFRNLNQGNWFGVNEDLEYRPASLSKLPIIIAYLKASESDASLLDKMIKIENYDSLEYENYTQVYAPEKSVEIGKEYSARDLIKYTVKYSDNTANIALFNEIGTAKIISVMEDLDLYNILEEPYDKISTKNYGAIFRLLYNSTYLSHENSEWLLQLLSESTFKQGLAGKLPSDIVVANKFGEKGFVVYGTDENHLINERSMHLHDCGIIYHPEKPYLLCVMTHGKEYSKLESIIQEISLIVYTGVD